MALFQALSFFPEIQRQLKNKGQFFQFCKLSDQVFIARYKISEEIKMNDSLIAQGATSSRIKPLPIIREHKDEMDKALNEQRPLINVDFASRNFFSSKEELLAEVESKLQEATIEWTSYVDPDSKETNSQIEMPAAEYATVAEESSAAEDPSTNNVLYIYIFPCCIEIFSSLLKNRSFEL